MNSYRIIRYATLYLLLVLSGGCQKDDPPKVTDPKSIFSECFIDRSTSTLDIVTFNVKTFPLSGETSIKVMVELINEMDADLIALQEVASLSDFNELDRLLTDYTGVFYPIDNDIWNLAYLYKNSEVTLNAPFTKIIFESDRSAFPRPPHEINITHSVSGLDVIIINNHLKCCGGEDNEARRRSASDQLHNYVEENYSDRAVIILGDLNDIIDGQVEADNVFWSFVNDPDNYRFADMDIAKGLSQFWSYPSWPSHIDHILISDELFTRVATTLVFSPDLCYPQYSSVISDHRPLFMSLR